VVQRRRQAGQTRAAPDPGARRRAGTVRRGLPGILKSS
jgi:hypothetical protein